MTSSEPTPPVAPPADGSGPTGGTAGAASPAAAALAGRPSPGRPPKPARPVWSATVTRTEWLSDSMVRVVLASPQLADFPELPHTDHYLKLIFPAPGTDDVWPFDSDELRATRPPEQRPVTRTYTVRWLDRTRNEIAIDFVVHGDAGLAGPWAAAARPGDQLGWRGPGGAYTPDPDAFQLLIGDDAALPAIAATLERLPPTAPALVIAEVAGPGDELELPRSRPGDPTRIHWVHRAGAAYGERLAEAVVELADAESLAGYGAPVQVFAHGNAEMIRAVRRHLFGTLRLSRDQVSISGYWRPGHDEDRWQATKRDFNAEMEADAVGAGQPSSGRS